MQVLFVLSMVLHWMATHPAETIMAFGALMSLMQKWLAKWPWAGKLAALASKVGVDLPGLKAEVMSKADAELPKAVEAAEKAVDQKVGK